MMDDTSITSSRFSSLADRSTFVVRRSSFVLWSISVAANLAIGLYILYSFRGQPGDDPYITYRYAYNLAAGDGFVFNAGEQVQSTTTPLFTVLLALGALAGAAIPPFAYALNVLAFLAFGLSCVKLVTSEPGTSSYLGLAAVALTLACPVTLFGLGSEMPLLIAFMWSSWWAAMGRRWSLAAFLSGLAAWTRGDGVLVGLAIAIYFLATHYKTHPRRWPWGAALVYLLASVPWYIFAWLYFGSPLPATLGAKIAQSRNPLTVSFFEGLGYFWTRSFGFQPLLWIPALLLLALGVVAIVRGGWSLRLPALWAALYIVGYSLLNVPRYPWYYSPLVPVAMLALVLGGAMLGRFLARRFDPANRLRAELAGGLLVGLLVGGYYFAGDLASPRHEPIPRVQLYQTVGEWLARNTPQDASIGTGEVGIIGYYSDRRIIDFVGLLQPEVAEHSARNDNLWPVQRYMPDYIVALPPWMVAVAPHPWIQEHYATVRTFHGPAGEQATLLKRR